MVTISNAIYRPSDESWKRFAVCRGMDAEIFFPGESGTSNTRAIAICNTCPAKKACLEYALERRIEHGVWGGKSERERRSIRRKRAGQALLARDSKISPTCPECFSLNVVQGFEINDDIPLGKDGHVIPYYFCRRCHARFSG